MSDVVKFPKDGENEKNKESESETKSVDDLEEAFESKAQGSLKHKIYYEDRKGYWHEVAQGRWIFRNERELRRFLIKVGYRSRAKKGQTQSEIDAFLCECEEKRRVYYAGPLAGYEAGFYRMNGKSILVTESPVLITPLVPIPEQIEANGYCAGWPILGGILERMLCDPGEKIDQRPYLFGHLHYTLECLYDSLPESGLAVAIAGAPESGKTLLLSLIKTIFGGRVAKPYEFMIGRDNFNEEMFESVLLLIDDETVETKMDARKKLGSWLKKFVANAENRCRGLHKKAISLVPLWRVFFLMNEEADSILVLPPIDASIKDKLMIFKAYKHSMPMPTDSARQKRAFWDALMAELPYFIHWLLYKYERPESIKGGRYYIKPFKHPDIIKNIYNLSKEAKIWNLIEKAIFKADKKQECYFPKYPRVTYLPAGMWIGTSQELCDYLRASDRLTVEDKKQIETSAAWMGQRLKSLSIHHGRTRIMKACTKSRDSKLWVLYPKKCFAEHFSDGQPSEFRNAVFSYLSEDQRDV